MRWGWLMVWKRWLYSGSVRLLSFVRKGQWWKSSVRESQDELSRLNEERWATWLKVASGCFLSWPPEQNIWFM